MFEEGSYRRRPRGFRRKGSSGVNVGLVPGNVMGSVTTPVAGPTHPNVHAAMHSFAGHHVASGGGGCGGVATSGSKSPAVGTLPVVTTGAGVFAQPLMTGSSILCSSHSSEGTFLIVTFRCEHGRPAANVFQLTQRR